MHHPARQSGGFSHQPFPPPSNLNMISKSKNPDESQFRVHFYLRNLFCGNMEPDRFVQIVFQRISKITRVQILQVCEQVDDKHVDVSVGLTRDYDAMALLVLKDKKILIPDEISNLKQYDPIPSRVFQTFIDQNKHLLPSQQRPSLSLPTQNPNSLQNKSPSVAHSDSSAKNIHFSEHRPFNPGFGSAPSHFPSPNVNNFTPDTNKNCSPIEASRPQKDREASSVYNQSEYIQHNSDKLAQKPWLKYERLDKSQSFGGPINESARIQLRQTASNLQPIKKSSGRGKSSESSKSSHQGSRSRHKRNRRKDSKSVSCRKSSSESDSQSSSSQGSKSISKSSSSSSSSSSQSSADQYRVQRVWIFAVPMEYHAKDVENQLEDNKLAVSSSNWKMSGTMEYLEVELKESVPERTIGDLQMRIYGYPVIVIPQLKNENYILTELGRFQRSIRFRRHIAEEEVIHFADKCGAVIAMLREEVDEKFLVVFSTIGAAKRLSEIQDNFKDCRVEKVKETLKIGRIDRLFTFEQLIKSLDRAPNRIQHNS